MEDSLKRSLKVLKEHESLITMVIGAMVIFIIGMGLLINMAAKIQKQEKPLNDLYIKANLLLSPSVTQFKTEAQSRLLPTLKPSQQNEPDKGTLAELLNISEIRDLVSLVRQQTDGQITQTSLATTAANLNLETPVSNSKTYIVARGDNLWKIAEKTLGSGYEYTQIIKTNNLGNANLIYPGQELVIPSERLSQNGHQVDKFTTKHVVVRGESLWSIAVLYTGNGFDFPKIVEANRDLIKNPNLIEPNWVLVIPTT